MLSAVSRHRLHRLHVIASSAYKLLRDQGKIYRESGLALRHECEHVLKCSKGSLLVVCVLAGDHLRQWGALAVFHHPGRHQGHRHQRPPAQVPASCQAHQCTGSEEERERHLYVQVSHVPDVRYRATPHSPHPPPLALHPHFCQD